MLGLLTKDLCLVKGRAQSLLAFLAVTVVMGVTMGASFVVGYGTMLMGIFTIGTLSYDEFDNCLPYLLTLPVTKKQYVREKYLFCGCGVLVGWVVSFVIALIVAGIHQDTGSVTGNWLETLVLLLVFFAAIGLLIPIQLKFGVERSRTVMIALGGGAAAVGYLGSRFLKPMENVTGFFAQLPETFFLIGIIAFCIAALGVCYMWSCRIMEKKQF